MEYVLDLGLSPYATSDLPALLEDSGQHAHKVRAFREYAGMLEDAAQKARLVADFLAEGENVEYIGFVPAEEGDVVYLVAEEKGTVSFEKALAFFVDNGLVADPD